LRGFEQPKAVFHDLALHHGVERAAASAAERKIGEHETGDTQVFNDIPRGSEDYSRNALGFEVSRDPTHGLVADGSDRREQDNVNSILATAHEHLGSVALGRHPLTVRRVDAMEARRDAADAVTVRRSKPC
jgi:hypothetical protein